MNRRSFLVLSLGTISTRVFSAPSSSSRFLLVFLRGGYDAANVLIPYSSDYYYQVRPNIAVPRDAVLKLDSDWALHPALRESIYALWLRGEPVSVGDTDVVIEPGEAKLPRAPITGKARGERPQLAILQRT